MRLLRPVSRHTTLTTAIALAVGLTAAGASTAAYAAVQDDSQTAPGSTWSAAAAQSDVTLAPFLSEEFALAATQPLAGVVDDAEKAIDEAEDAVADAEAAEKKVAATSLRVAGAKTIDTSELEEHIEVLETVTQVPTLLVPVSAESAAADTAKVEKATSSLLTRLDKAEKKRAAAVAAKKAAAKKAAAEKAARERAAREAEQAQQAQSSGGSSGGSSSGGVSGGSAASSGDNSVSGAKATARALLGNYGWGADQFSCLEKLWQKESGWNYRAYNSSSGAYGIPQALPGSKMGSAGGDWKTSAATQIRWGLGYIDGRYGTPCGAWGHSTSVGWY